MFEVVVTACLLTASDTCRAMLVPGLETMTKNECEVRLSEAVIPNFANLTVSKPSCQSVGKKGNFQEIAAGVFAHRGAVADVSPENYGDISNTGFVIGEASVAVIDTGGSRMVAEEMYRAIRSNTDLPISHVILTHMHPDHVLGAGFFRHLGSEIVAHEKMGAAFTDRTESYLTSFIDLMGAGAMIGTETVLPDTPISGAQDIDLGGRVLELRSWQTSHTTNDLTVFDPTSGVLFTGDLVFHEHTPALDGSVRGWVRVLEELRGIPAKVIVPGHGGPVLGWPDGAQDLSRYLQVLSRDTKRAIDAGESLSSAVETIAVSEEENWLLFELYNARNATVAYTEIEWE